MADYYLYQAQAVLSIEAGRRCIDAFTPFMHQRPFLIVHQFYQTPAIASIWIDASAVFPHTKTARWGGFCLGD
jgi:hypothetical protein